MAFFKQKSEEEQKAEWLKLSKNKWNWIMVKGIISYGLPLGLTVYLSLYITGSIPKDDIVTLGQIMGLFFAFGIIRAIFRFNFYTKKFGKK